MSLRIEIILGARSMVPSLSLKGHGANEVAKVFDDVKTLAIKRREEKRRRRRRAASLFKVAKKKGRQGMDATANFKPRAASLVQPLE